MTPLMSRHQRRERSCTALLLSLAALVLGREWKPRVPRKTLSPRECQSRRGRGGEGREDVLTFERRGDETKRGKNTGEMVTERERKTRESEPGEEANKRDGD